VNKWREIVKKLKWLFIAAIAMIVGNGICLKNICKIIDDNEERIPIEISTGLTEREFNSVISEFLTVNKPLAKAQGFELVIQNRWLDATVNANTIVKDKKWIINAYGGLARYDGMTADAYTMVLCHELGHHLGGFPKIGWASNEGQSDYYAASKCFPRMAASKKKAINVPNIVTKQCSLLHKSKQEIRLCEKTSMVGLQLANILNSLSRLFAPLNCVLDPLKPVYCPQNLLIDISFSTPDKVEVLKTYNGHPEAQCRLDTYFAGAICNMPHNEDFSNSNAITGACAEERGDKIGVRPRCWYKPELFI
jgi:hypothetical protein